MLADFDLAMPETLDQALAVLSAERALGRDGLMPLAGGTNLVVDLRAGHLEPRRLVGVQRIPDLDRVEIADGAVEIGARVTVSDLLHHPEMGRLAPSLVASARVFAGQMVRNTATVAGNVCYGSPAADLVPPLLALDAEVTLASAAGTRTLALCDFYTGYKADRRRADELMTAIRWPVPRGRNLFYKLARRKGDAITVVGIAVTLAIAGGRCAHVRIALGAVTPYVTRARAAEAMIAGEAPSEALFAAAGARAAEEASPIDDIRASADYRRHCTAVLVRRLLNDAWQAQA